ncbi:MAG TPA: YetF domain-containing protein [Roseiflexaceae bacterium]|nr:YetF domain-containing protein [Roseiflexaceae bacterium]
MSNWFDVDWRTVFLPSTPLLEIFVRGTVVYLTLFVLLRVVVKRQAGTVSITDLLVVVLLADAAQNAMADDYRAIPDGLLLIATIVFWSYLLEWLGYRFPAVERFVHPPALPLVREGRVLRQNMRREMITDEELMSQLREQGVDDLSQVKEAALEGDGRVSVVTRDSQARGTPERDQL